MQLCGNVDCLNSIDIISSLIIEKVIEEAETKTFAFTEQFLNIHKLAYMDNKPKIARIDTDKEGEAIVYFNIENEKFFLAVYIDINPNVSVRWINTEPYHSVYFRVLSDIFSLAELKKITTLIPTKERNKGDKKHPDSKSDLVWKRSAIDFEPNPEADEFEDKLDKLLDYLEQDKEGVYNLIKDSNGYIQVNSSYHNGNSLLGGVHINKSQIKRMSELNLEIDFDISVDGNEFN